MRGGRFVGLGERLRLWLAAVLIDLGNWLSLDPAERRARRVWRRLEGRLARTLGRRVALGLMGADFVAPPVAEEEHGQETGGHEGGGAARYLGMVVARRTDPAGARVDLRCLVRCPVKGRKARRRGGGEEEEIVLWEVTRKPPAPAGTDGSAPRGGITSRFSRDHESALLSYYFDGFRRSEEGPTGGGGRASRGVEAPPPVEGGSPDEGEAAVPEWAPGSAGGRANEESIERRRNVIGELDTMEALRDYDVSPEEPAAQEKEDGFGGPTAQELLLAEQFAAEIAAEAASEGSAHDPFAELGLAGAYDIDEEDLWPGEAVFFGDAISSLADETAEEEIEEITA